MTNRPGYYDRLQFISPLSDARADALAQALAERQPAAVLDIGCGFAELLLRVVAATPGATGLGVDSDEVLIARGQANAAERGLSDRIRLIASDGNGPLEPADVVICIGADHVYGDQAAALAALHGSVRPGGVLLFGSGYWQRPPTEDEAAGLGATPEEFLELAALVDLAIEHGYRPLDLQTANEDEWNAFESGYLSDWEVWLLQNPDGPDADELRAKADEHRAGWLRGYRGVLGFAYLTLGVPAS